MKVLGRSAAAGCKFDREIWSNELSPVLNLWKKLNQVSAGVVLQLLPRFPPYPFFFFFFSQFYPQIVSWSNFALPLPVYWCPGRRRTDKPERQGGWRHCHARCCTSSSAPAACSCDHCLPSLCSFCEVNDCSSKWHFSQDSGC